jgi:hypothetical protein
MSQQVCQDGLVLLVAGKVVVANKVFPLDER